MVLVLTKIEQWRQWNRNGEYTCLPYVEVFPWPEANVPDWRGLRQETGEPAIILESGRNSESGGRYTFVIAEPKEWISGNLEQGYLTSHSQRRGIIESFDGPPLTVLREWMGRYRSPKAEDLPKFVGGIAGYLSYDVVRTLEKLPRLAAEDSKIPDYFFMRTEELWILDHAERRLICAVHAVREPNSGGWDEEGLSRAYEDCASRACSMRERWERWMRQDGHSQDEAEAVEAQTSDLHIDVGELPGLELSLEREAFVAAVEKIQAYISQGDVFQVNLSVRQQKEIAATPEDVYEILHRINPSPYMAYLRLPDNQALVSASPELLIRLENGRISTRPIAGTRPRGADRSEDEALKTELLLNEKERAEHVMLVDLERNDIGRIAKYGSVRVKEFMAIERYSHVMHIVSEVEGELAEGKDAFDAIAAVFPGGTITGAPKIRTMEIIEELEPVRRGAYTGSIGWIDYSGNMELNITIRTLQFADGIATVQSGAGIVIDSVPQSELKESLNKAKALWKAVQIAEALPGRAEMS
jgi:para-aminobenzoate synthetase component I